MEHKICNFCKFLCETIIRVQVLRVRRANPTMEGALPLLCRVEHVRLIPDAAISLVIDLTNLQAGSRQQSSVLKASFTGHCTDLDSQIVQA